MNAWQFMKLYLSKYNKKKILLIYIFGLAMCLFMVASTINYNAKSYNDKKKDWTTVNVVNVLNMTPIEEDLLKWIQINTNVQSVKIVKGVDLFLAYDEKNEHAMGVYHFEIIEKPSLGKDYIFLSEELFHQIEQENKDIYMSYEDENIQKLDKSNIALGEQNCMSIEFFQKFFSKNTNSLGIFSLEVTLLQKTDINAFEKELLQRGLKFNEHNDTGFILSENLSVLQYLLYSIIFMNLVISIIVVIRLCIEDRRNYSIMKIHGYQNKTLSTVQLLKFYVVLFHAFVVAIIVYTAIVLSMQYIFHFDIEIVKRYVIICLSKLLGFEVLFGGGITIVICFIYNRMNYLRLLKQSK